MRRSWPFLVYAVVALVHLVQIGAGLPGRDVTKPLLMGSLLLAVLLTALLTDRGAAPRGRRLLGLLLLCAGIALSLAGDELLGPSFVAGLACFAAAQLAYIALSLGPARGRSRKPYLLGIVYLAWIIVLCVLLWPRLGGMAIPVIVYGIVLAGTATTTAGVNAVAGLGGLLFLASDSMLAFRLFARPEFSAAFPDPWQDLGIMLTYCLGEGLIAYGALRRLRRR